MTMTLTRVRPCDGACCLESPRFPNRDHTDCVYHVMSRGPESSGCTLMMNPDNIPEGMSEIEPKSTCADLFKRTCLDWPQKNSRPEEGDTGGCCWQYVEE